MQRRPKDITPCFARLTHASHFLAKTHQSNAATPKIRINGRLQVCCIKRHPRATAVNKSRAKQIKAAGIGATRLPAFVCQQYNCRPKVQLPGLLVKGRLEAAKLGDQAREAAINHCCKGMHQDARVQYGTGYIKLVGSEGVWSPMYREYGEHISCGVRNMMMRMPDELKGVSKGRQMRFFWKEEFVQTC